MIERNSCILGDCLDVMKEIDSCSIDMILCDLPYGTTQNKWDSVIDFGLLWESYKRIIKDNGAIILTAQPPFDKVLGMSNLDWLKYEWIWIKNKATGHLNANKMPMKQHENILVFYKNLPTFNPQGLVFKSELKIRKGGGGNGKNYGESSKDATQRFENYPNDILEFDLDKTVGHPTQKPVSLFGYLIQTYTNEGDLVLDNCAGSHTTALACMNTGRDYICIEKEKEYHELGKKRIENNVSLFYF